MCLFLLQIIDNWIAIKLFHYSYAIYQNSLVDFAGYHNMFLYPPPKKLWGYTGFTSSVRQSVQPFVDEIVFAL